MRFFKNTALIVAMVNGEDTWNILSMDGGGIRGLVTAKVVQNMEKYGYTYALSQGYIEERDDGRLNMSEIFDMMAGTSTGSLLTTALTMPDENGNNKFNSDDVINVYRNRGKQVFTKYVLGEGWKVFWGFFFCFLLGFLGYLDGRNRFHNKTQEKTFRDFEKLLKRKEQKAGMKVAVNEEEEQKSSLLESMEMNYDMKRMLQRATVVAHNDHLESEVQAGSKQALLEAEDALQEMRENYQSKKKYKWFFVALGASIGFALGYFGSDLTYKATHSLNNRAGIEEICSELFKEVPITKAKTEVFIVSFDYTYGTPIFFTKHYAENPEIKGQPDLYDTSLANAAEASAAAPIYFSPKVMGDHVLIDGGVIANNPSLYAYEFANKILKKKKVRVFSIGTALGPGNKLQSDNVNLLDWAVEISSLITTPEQKTHTWVAKYLSEHSDNFEYHRYNYKADRALSLDMIAEKDLNEFEAMGESIYTEKKTEIEELIRKMCDEKLKKL